jgi:hypothetical protein
MKLHKFLAALALAVGLAGCAPVDSLNPLYTDKDVVFDETLLGQWGPPKDGMNIAKLGENGYRLVISGPDDDTGQIVSMVLDAHFVNLQGHRFLDVVCKDCGSATVLQALPEVHITHTKSGVKIEPRLVGTGWSTYMELLPGESDGDEDRFSMRPRQAHWIFKVVLEDEGRTLKLVQLDDSWIDHQIEDGHLAIDHEIMDGKSAVLTASTPDLQQLVLDHVYDDEAFKGETTYRRPAPDSQP